MWFTGTKEQLLQNKQAFSFRAFYLHTGKTQLERKGETQKLALGSVWSPKFVSHTFWCWGGVDVGGFLGLNPGSCVCMAGMHWATSPALIGVSLWKRFFSCVETQSLLKTKQPTTKNANENCDSFPWNVHVFCYTITFQQVQLNDLIGKKITRKKKEFSFLVIPESVTLSSKNSWSSWMETVSCRRWPFLWKPKHWEPLPPPQASNTSQFGGCVYRSPDFSGKLSTIA